MKNIDFTDEEEMKIIELNDELHNYIVMTYLNDFIAYYLYKLYKCPIDVLEGTTTQLFNSALVEFNNLKIEDISEKKVKDILLRKYKLEIIDNDYTKLKEI